MKIAVLFTKRDENAKSDCPDWEGRDTNDDTLSVIKALKDLGHEVSMFHVDENLYPQLLEKKKEIDLVFNMCDDGFYSDADLEPHLPAMLDVLDINFTGSDYFALALCLDKTYSKKILHFNGIPTPAFQLFKKETEAIDESLAFPMIVKPAYEDASIGIKDESVVYNEDDLRARIKHIIVEYDQSALVENFIDGREFNVGIVGTTILPIAEISFDGLPKHKPKIVNYDAKWKEDSIDYKETKRVCPTKIDDELKSKLETFAKKASDILLCSDYLRVDFRVDKNDNPYVLEVNPNPDISEDAGLAAMAKAKNISYKEMINMIIESATGKKNISNDKKEK